MVAPALVAAALVTVSSPVSALQTT
ncbi:uncharacterized protein METZ01_LOCUS439210, partial [marine metagenome]